MHSSSGASQGSLGRYKHSVQPNMDEEMPSAAPASGGSSDDSDSDFEEVEASAEDVDLITSLEAELSANANLYDKHVEVRRRVLHSATAGGAKQTQSILQAHFLLDQLVCFLYSDNIVT